MVDRDEVMNHLYWVLRPRLSSAFIDEVIFAIEAVATDRGRLEIEIDYDRMSATQAVHIWELEEFVDEERCG